MGFLKERIGWLSLVGVAVLVMSACGHEEAGPGRYSAHGTVEDVDRESAQILIEHDDVDGLMPAMTMNFSVPDQALLAKLEPGQVIDFEIDFTGRSYQVVAADVVGVASAEAGWFRLREGSVRTTPAPDFDLIDQAGRPVSLASLGDRVLVVDFIYTSCRGPCPVQTSIQAALQRRIPEALRDDVQFVSISLDPEIDRPDVLLRYATERGADLSTWSFLTGPTDQVAEVVRRWGVGSVRKEDGTLDHTLVRFLVQDGRVIERYWTSDGLDETLLADLTALAKTRDGTPVE